MGEFCLEIDFIRQGVKAVTRRWSWASLPVDRITPTRPLFPALTTWTEEDIRLLASMVDRLLAQAEEYTAEDQDCP